VTSTGSIRPIRPPDGRLPPLRTLSFCTGIAGDKAAFQLAGIACQTVAVAEIDPLASAVLAQKFPTVPRRHHQSRHQVE